MRTWNYPPLIQTCHYQNFNIFFSYTCILYYSYQKDERAKPGTLLINFLTLTLLDEDSIFEALTCLRRLVTGLSTRRPVFESKPVLARFTVNKVALGQVFPNTTVFPCVYHSTTAPYYPFFLNIDLLLWDVQMFTWISIKTVPDASLRETSDLI